MKWTISTAIDSTIANSFLSRMHKSMGNSILIIEKERLIREVSSQEKTVKGSIANTNEILLYFAEYDFFALIENLIAFKLFAYKLSDCKSIEVLCLNI